MAENRTREGMIQVRVTPEERATIEANAAALGMRIAPYTRWVAQNPNIVVYDYQLIRDHTNKLAELRHQINRLIFTIDHQNYYLPREIESIVWYMQEAFKTENELLETIRKEHERLRKLQKPVKAMGPKPDDTIIV